MAMEVTNTTGRRKAAIARVYLSEGTGVITINKKPLEVYFPSKVLQYIVKQAFLLSGNDSKFDVKATLVGGGITGQAEALRLGISRALVEVNPEIRAMLKPFGLMTRDPREVERKKPGQPKARKRFQFSKR
ncbi:small subunit ribosomal protein S9 [Williamwhitmania taraxaci]|uniref:Small ribosomal subunit protein uS9 n=2 Tax=Williamwhitmania taraxaci TaxID=1640674 RepID=A0A1G6QGA0_9BACT|nr:small subunit ribosomal protein S9 [Williamwhitmania taraxaci]